MSLISHRQGTRAALIATYAITLGFALSWILRNPAPFIATITAGLGKFGYDAVRDRHHEAKKIVPTAKGYPIPPHGD